jgi:endonuclease-3
MKNNNFENVFKTFSKYYKPIPLEVYHTNIYKTLISTLLSSRTKDEVTLKASEKLFKRAPDIFKLSKLDYSEISALIYPVGFYKTKAKYLKALSKIIINDFKGTIPKTREKLITLPGVGRKTANLVLNRVFNTPSIAVDTHVHKISNLLGWVKTKTPEETEKELIKILPKKYWKDINRLFVSIGRQNNTKKKLENTLSNEGLINTSNLRRPD